MLRPTPLGALGPEVQVFQILRHPIPADSKMLGECRPTFELASVKP